MKKKDHIEVLGMMSGTSLDGLDLALCRFPAALNGFEIISARTVSYPDVLRDRLAESVSLSAQDLFSLDAELGKYMGNEVQKFLAGTNSRPDLIASHGHTVYHQPQRGFTVQIGNAAHIHAITGIRVISDFRSLDVALGGQGAPLVPVGDALLFPEYDYCLNLGGIANVSFDDNGIRRAYDICACNMVLNHLAARKGLSYDPDGKMAASGSLIPDVSTHLDNWEYLAQRPPKSLGFEEVSASIFPLLTEDHAVEDLLHTFVMHIAAQIAVSCRGKGGSILVTGGGAHNQFLISQLRDVMPEMEIVCPSKEIIDYKEALIFAFLGALRHNDRLNVLSSVTGAIRDHSGGQIIG